MLKSNTKIAFSLIYLEIALIIWANVIIPYFVIFILSIAPTIPSLEIVLFFRCMVQYITLLIGGILLIISAILYAISTNKDYSSLSNIGFGLGVPAWVLILISFGVSFGRSFFILIYAAIAMCPIMLFGFILFAEANNFKGKINSTETKSVSYKAYKEYKTYSRTSEPTRDIKGYDTKAKSIPKDRHRSVITNNTTSYKAYNQYEPESRVDNIHQSKKVFKFCHNCGRKLYYTDKYCYYCGEKQWLI